MVDLRSLRPLDRTTIVESVKKTNRAVVFEEDWRSYGVGAEIAATIQEYAFDYLDAPVRRIAAAEVALPYSKVMELLGAADGPAPGGRGPRDACGLRRDAPERRPRDPWAGGAWGGGAWLKSRCLGCRTR